MADKTKKIAIITGSTRPVRVGPQVAKFVTEILEKNLHNDTTNKAVQFTLSQVEIALFKLPVFDESVIPAVVPMVAQFEHEHSKAWSAEMAKFDGYVLVTGEYNLGVPGGIKNAFDYLFNEIKAKPFLIISYGKNGGNYSSEAMRRTLAEGIFSHVVETRPTLPFAKNEPFQFGLPHDLLIAGAGILGEQSLKEWEAERKSDIVRGFGELKEYLAREPEPTPA